MKNKYLLIGGTIILCAALFFIGTSLKKKFANDRLAALAAQKKALLEPMHSPVLGSENAKVTLVQFLDPESDTCRIFHPAVKELLAEHAGDIRWVVRYAPFHPNSRTAILLLEAARRQGKYWQTLDLFFENLPHWGDRLKPKPELLWTYLAQADVNVEQARKDIKDPEIKKNIEQDRSDAKALGLKMIPGFYVNGKALNQFGINQLRAFIQNEM